jgi:hypothetical protein
MWIDVLRGLASAVPPVALIGAAAAIAALTRAAAKR